VSAIFYHERQQASDNIFIQLQYGARVFMSETSLAYSYLKELGFHIYSLQKDLSLLYTPLSDEQVIENRRILVNNYSSWSLVQRINKIVDVLS
jgi:hypothetical protein